MIDAAPYKGFPKVWHTADDHGENLDLNTVEDWSMLVTAFAAEWMELEGYLQDSNASGKRGAEKRSAKDWDKTEL